MANPETLTVLRHSGYAVVRSPQPAGRDDHLTAAYLTFMGAFHSRAHKHADDLSVTWFDAGQELLIDSGRFGYLNPLPPDSPQRMEGFFYDRPERQYVESTRAHNTVEVDGRDHERRNRRPYGCAITSASQRDQHYRLIGKVDHGHWTHHRRILLKPGSWLWVTDNVVSNDGQAHDFRVWWNLPEALGAPSREAGLIFGLAGSSRMLWVQTYSTNALTAPVRGQLEPLRGWRSRIDLQFTPVWSFSCEAPRRRRHKFETLLTIGSSAPDELPSHPFKRGPGA
jgi:hypothetical protein